MTIRIVYIFLLLVYSHNSFGQNINYENDSMIMEIHDHDTIFIEKPVKYGDSHFRYIRNTQQAHFKGNITDFIKKNMKYPYDAKQKNIQGTVRVYSKIDTDGKLAHSILLNNVYPSIDSEALRIVNLMQDWQPMIMAGRKIKVDVEIDVPFKLN